MPSLEQTAADIPDAPSWDFRLFQPRADGAVLNLALSAEWPAGSKSLARAHLAAGRSGCTGGVTP